MPTQNSIADSEIRNSLIAIVMALFVGLNIFLSFNYHSHGSRHSYHGSLWADRAGYFVYLPATFHLGFTSTAFPSGLDTLTGNGFKLHTSSGLVHTKYTCGVSIMQAPIYVLGHGIGKLLGFDVTPFGDVDHAVVSIAGPVYVSLGLLLLFFLLSERYQAKVALLSILTIYAGTNLYYYSVSDPGMSHAYSFFLFSSLLFVLERIRHNRFSRRNAVVLGAILGLILLIRPTNLVFVVLAPLVSIHGRGDLRDRLKGLPGLRTIYYACLTAAFVWLPQLIYWKMAYGSYFTWPYIGEGFTNLTTPRLTQFLFSTNNGLVPYTPLIVFVIAGAIALYRSAQRELAFVIVVSLMSITYLSASWWVWDFGCGFGSRTIVEYWALFVFPVATIHQILNDRFGKLTPVFLFLAIIIIELKMIYSYGNCWFQGDWNWQAYGQLIFGPTK